MPAGIGGYAARRPRAGVRRFVGLCFWKHSPFVRIGNKLFRKKSYQPIDKVGKVCYTVFTYKKGRQLRGKAGAECNLQKNRETGDVGRG